jgi:hypothetical protein
VKTAYLESSESRNEIIAPVLYTHARSLDFGLCRQLYFCLSSADGLYFKQLVYAACQTRWHSHHWLHIRALNTSAQLHCCSQGFSGFPARPYFHLLYPFIMYRLSLNHVDTLAVSFGRPFVVLLQLATTPNLTLSWLIYLIYYFAAVLNLIWFFFNPW